MTKDFKLRVFYLINKNVKSAAVALINNLPEDAQFPLKISIEPYKKQRTNPQNALMWGARLSDIAEQGWVDGRQFSSEVWHEYLKALFLPELGCEDYEKLVTKNYAKWAEMPDGSMSCTGSTTQLTTLGFTRYLEQCDAYAANELGVRYSAKQDYGHF